MYLGDHAQIQDYNNSTKPEPNMLKTLPIIPSSTSQKITHFILISLPIIPI